MNKVVVAEDVVETIKSFLSYNEGDETTEELILSIGAEMLDISIDTMLEMIK